VLEGVDGGQGVLLWVRSRDSTVGGEYQVLARGDSITPRGAAGSARFMLQTADGVVTISSAGGRIDAQVRGSGIDPNAGRRVALDASFQAVAITGDTVSCRVQLKP